MKTVVITGATSGIGNLLVREFVKQGCLVFAGYRKLELKKSLEKISDEITPVGLPQIVPFYIDMSKKWTVSNAAKFILEKTEKIDTLINAAGCVVAGPMECLDVDKIRKQFDVNTFSHLQFTQELLPKLFGGRVINISSMASFGLFPFVAPYCASKRALDILFNSMQIECGAKCNSDSVTDKNDSCKWANIKIISIKPGVIKTPLWEKSIESNKDVLGENEKYQKEMEFMVRNAQENSEKGLDPQKVIDLIVKVEALENPKPSYTIGLDAKIAEIVSHLPQGLINKIICKKMEQKILH